MKYGNLPNENNNQFIKPMGPMGYNGPPQQMKKTLLLAVATLFATFSFAQQQLATLNHNDSITVYYGASALQQAHSAAVNGDIITLSPGSFNSENITKAVSIRGAGMFPDTTAGTGPTTLINSFTVTINNDSLHNLCIEGINCTGTLIYSKIYNPQFVKCWFNKVEYLQSSSMANSSLMVSASFINCVIKEFKNHSYSTTARYTQFVNSVILYFESQGNPSLINSIAKLSNNNNELNNVSISNSIVYYDANANANNYVNANTSFNSIGINASSSSYNYFNATGLPNHNLHNYHGFASVFKNFRGSYNDGITFELLDTVAATCLGSDGTQVGIYGGMMPFDPSVRNPLIKKCNVASRSTADGKLAVDIEIVSE